MNEVHGVATVSVHSNNYTAWHTDLRKRWKQKFAILAGENEISISNMLYFMGISQK